MRPVRVLHVITTTDHRGAEVFGFQLSAALEDLGHHGRIVALAPGRSPALLPVPALGARRLGVTTLRALRAAARDASVVVAHGSTTLPAVAAATAGTGVPFVYRSIGDPMYWSTRLDRRLWVGQSLRRAAAVVALWESAAAELVRRHRLPQARVHVVPNGVPGARFLAVTPAERGPARRAFGLDEGAPVVAYVGALSAEKEVGAAVRAVGALGDAQLVIAGDGPEAARLRRAAEQAAPGRVRFIGAVDDVVPVLAAADVLVLPSRTEGIPAVLIEAGLAGVPAVATAVGGVPEVILHGETGALVEPGDDDGLARAIALVLGQATRLGAAARLRCRERFELGPVTLAWAEVLEGVSGEGGV